MAKRRRRPIVWVKHRRKRSSKREREFIYKRDNYTCQICGKDLTELPEERILDHRLPLSQFGSNKLSNIWLLCSECDKEKKSEILPQVLEEEIKKLNDKIYGTIKNKL